MPPAPNNTKAKYWIATIPQYEFSPPYLPNSCAYIKGQIEQGERTNYLHWQLFIITCNQIRLSGLKKIWPTGHFEATRSSAAEEYVWKEDTRIEGTQIELGSRPFKRNSSTDWAEVLRLAKLGECDGIPPQVYIGHYRNIKAIGAENSTPLPIERTCDVFWGRTGSGKSHRAWSEAGLDAYPKDPCTKFWDGYRGQEHVVIDEFRGSIGISHMLRWLDKYPVLVEVKGSSTVFKAIKVWITSNIHPRDWYKDIDEVTYLALERRLNITELN